VRCADILACVAVDIVDGNCRQNVPAVNLRIQSLTRLATRSSSIKQIEIFRVRFENHLRTQMETILIQKGNSINRDCRFGTSPGSWASKQRALKPGCGFSNADRSSAAKIFTHLLQN